MLMLGVSLVFIAIFLFIIALVGFGDEKANGVKRMNRYVNAVTADVNAAAGLNPIAKSGIHQNEDLDHSFAKSRRGPGAAKQFRTILEKYGKKFEARGYTQQIELELQKGDLPLRGYEFLMIIAGSTLGAILLIFTINSNLLSMVVAGILGFFTPLIFLRVKQQRKAQRFNGQIGDALVLISNALKSGYGFLQAMEMVAKEMAPPIQTEFGRVLQEINLGIATEDALYRLTNRVNSQDLDLVVTAMLIQRQIGGNLSEILDNISDTIRERIRIKGEVKSLTAQGRLSGFIIGVLPIALGMFLLMINPKYIIQLFSDPRGQLMLGYAGVAEIIAVIIIRKIIDIKV